MNPSAHFDLGQMVLRTVILVALAPTALPAADTYSVVDVGIAPGHHSAIPIAVSSSGAVAGRIEKRHGGGERAFYWTKAGGRKTIRPLAGGDECAAYGVNDAVQVVGSSNTAGGLRAFLWSGNKSTDLGTLSGDTDSEAFAINSSGQIVGYSSGSSGEHAFVLNPQGGLHALGTLPGDSSSQALGINDNGDVVGVSFGTNGTRPFRWSQSRGMQALPLPAGATGAVALRINALGQVIGRVTSPLEIQAVIWNADGSLIALGTLPGGDYSEATGINGRSQVVGAAGSTLGTHAFIWTADQGLQDLNGLLESNPGVLLAGAVAINDNGQIAAYGTLVHDEGPEEVHDEDHGAPLHVFLLTPTQMVAGSK